MELIVSTPQGEAEISVSAAHESVTLGDLLERVLNAPPPHLVYVDGRPTPIGTLLSAAGLLVGTVIETTPPLEHDRPADVTLVQAAGEGGGSRRSLDAGRYSLGTARRANVAPLTFNQVLVPRCELVVEHSGHVTVTANQGDLDGRLAANDSSWDHQRLRIGHRVFRLDAAIDDRAESLTPTPQGQLIFVRPPRDQEPPEPETNGRSRGGARRLRRSRAEPVEPAPVPAPIDPVRAAFEEELDKARRTHLDLGEVVRRAMQLSERLWERRPIDDDAFVFSVGLADQPWTPEDPGIERRDLGLLPTAPVLVDLVNERGIGFACAPTQARAAARALILQACVAHSPADLDVVVLSSRAGGARWEWIKWLPHSRGAHGVQLLCDKDAITDWVNSQRTLTAVVASIQSLGRPITPSRLTLAVVDDPALWRGRAAMLRGLFAEAQLPVRFVALTDRADDVPAVCTTVVRIAANGAAEVDYPIGGPTVNDVVPFVLEHDVAVAAARRLSPIEDYTAQAFAKTALPSVVPLASLIDPDGVDTDRILARWEGPPASRLLITVGMTEDGPAHLDFADDGPNALIVGARRSGKTELLRTIVAALIAANAPSTLNVVCVEASDGTSFAAFAGADHIVGTVQRFDEHGGLRLLRALRSEAGRRARLLADHHAIGISDYRLDADRPPLPHLVVVIDDVDEIMARHAAFLPQLLEITEPSRHLGIHVILASERLSKSVENSFGSLADIRIALHMNDPAEAIALTGSREPAQISSHSPGRGVIKVGEDDAFSVQFASSSTASGDLVEITPFILARDLNAAERKITPRLPEPGSAPPQGGLRHLVEAITAAARRVDTAVEPLLCAELPLVLHYDELATDNDRAGDQGAAFAISDLPDDRVQRLRRWKPGADGNMLVVGGSPAERWSALTTLFVAVTDATPPTELHGYMIDCAANRADDTSVLESLVACGAVATADDPDRIVRVLSRLTDELETRSSGESTTATPTIVLFVNEVTAFLRTLELAGELEQGRDMLERLVGKGPLHGICTVMSSAGEHGVPARLLGQFQQRVLLHLGDRSAYRALDIDSARVPMEVAGRAITAPDLVEIQIATIADLSAIVEARRDRDGDVDGPSKVLRTPPTVDAAELYKSTELAGGTWRIPVGLDTRTLQPAMLRLTAPGGGLVLGDSGTGKSTVLMNIARCVSSIDSEVDVHAIAATWSPLALLPHLASATTLAGIDKWAGEFFDNTDRARMVLVDDADRLDGAVFERLAALDDSRLVVVAAGRTRVLELPGHWTAPLRRSRAAVLLRPLAGDAAMFGLYLRTTSTLPGVGRGFVVDDDTITPVLLAAPGDDREARPR